MLLSLNFVNFMGNFCKVFAAHKQVRDSAAFLYQLLVFCFCCLPQEFFGISQKFTFLPFLKPKKFNIYLFVYF